MLFEENDTEKTGVDSISPGEAGENAGEWGMDAREWSMDAREWGMDAREWGMEEWRRSRDAWGGVMAVRECVMVHRERTSLYSTHCIHLNAVVCSYIIQ